MDGFARDSPGFGEPDRLLYIRRGKPSRRYFSNSSVHFALNASTTRVELTKVHVA